MRRHVTLLVAAASVTLVLSGCASNSVLDLRVGDCFSSADLGTDQVTSIDVVECSTEHDVEVYGDHTFSGSQYPGVDTVREESDAACRALFTDFVGASVEDSSLHYSTLYPTEDSWDDTEDRTALCLVLSDAPVTGTLEGHAR